MVRCGQCSKEFEDKAEYLVHVCEVTKVTPTDPKSMGKFYEQIQAAALKRGLNKQ